MYSENSKNSAIRRSMEIEKTDFDSSWSGLDMAKSEASDGFISLDVEHLSLLVPSYALSPAVVSGENDSTVGVRAPFQKTLARKGSQHGAERKSGADSTAATAGAGRETAAVQINVGSEGDAASLPPEKASSVVAAVAGGSGRCRRIAGRRPAPWLDPRRVLVLFATLSSMGTLILLYFTLSMGKMTGSDANAR